jgi:CRISPR-associated protein Cas5t
MITLRVKVPYASFRKSYARSFAETYPFPPPATVYGMLLSLVGERSRSRHVGAALAFAYAHEPRTSTTLRKLSRLKYGVPSKQSKLGNAPEFVETLCGIDFLCWVESRREVVGVDERGARLEARLVEAILHPERVQRTGVLCLGLSDDAVDDIAQVDGVEGDWRWLSPTDSGSVELPVWVDHVGSQYTRWQRYELEPVAHTISAPPGEDRFTTIVDPRQ